MNHRSAALGKGYARPLTQTWAFVGACYATAIVTVGRVEASEIRTPTPTRALPPVCSPIGECCFADDECVATARCINRECVIVTATPTWTPTSTRGVLAEDSGGCQIAAERSNCKVLLAALPLIAHLYRRRVRACLTSRCSRRGPRSRTENGRRRVAARAADRQR